MLAGICGGCKHTAVSYDEQLKLKNDFVKSLLDSAVDYDYEYEGIIKSPLIFAYRNKMEYSFGDEKKDGPLTLGLHKKRSYYDVINCDSCLLVHDDFNKIVRATREYFAELGVTYKDKRSHKGYLRHLLIRRAVNTGDILIDLVTTGESPKRVEKHSDINVPDKIIEVYDARETVDKWAEIIKGIELTGNIIGILNTINDSMADAIKNDRTDIIYGEDHIYEEILGLRFKITPFSFFQTNSKGAEVLYKKAREYVLWNGSDSEAERLSDSSEGTPEEKLSDKVVYDLYSGTGTIAQVLSPSAKEVIGVEIVEEAVEAARENAKLNGLDNCSFIAGDVLKTLDNISEKPDLIVLDPPRDGINPKALKKIVDYGVDRIVYISCKAQSLARDLGPLQYSGYRMVKACAVDQFPWTDNVETVVLLSKGEIDSKKVRVEFSLEDMDMSGFQNDATYSQIKERVLQQTGLKVSSLYIAQIKQKHGIIERENYNKPKSENTRQPKCPPEKEAAITEALKYFGMI